MAQHDGLTGLPHRNLLRQRMDEILQHTRRSADKVAVLVLGLDNFKAVNDTLGHGAGDSGRRRESRACDLTHEQSDGHSGAMRTGPRKARPDDRLRIEPGISRFPDAQLRIRGLVLRTIPE
jgi:hypothetical protein